jgi:hypothetical protein
VTDPHIADIQLLPLLLEGGQTTVSTFGRKQHNLEEIFLAMVEGGTVHGNIYSRSDNVLDYEAWTIVTTSSR